MGTRVLRFAIFLAAMLPAFGQPVWAADPPTVKEFTVKCTGSFKGSFKLTVEVPAGGAATCRTTKDKKGNVVGGTCTVNGSNSENGATADCAMGGAGCTAAQSGTCSPI